MQTLSLSYIHTRTHTRTHTHTQTHGHTHTHTHTQYEVVRCGLGSKKDTAWTKPKIRLRKTGSYSKKNLNASPAPNVNMVPDGVDRRALFIIHYPN